MENIIERKNLEESKEDKKREGREKKREREEKRKSLINMSANESYIF